MEPKSVYVVYYKYDKQNIEACDRPPSTHATLEAAKQAADQWINFIRPGEAMVNTRPEAIIVQGMLLSNG